MKEYFVH